MRTIARRVGVALDDRPVMRVFTAPGDGSAASAAAAVRVALLSVDEPVSLVVLPAAFGLVPPVRATTPRGERDYDRVVSAARAWARELRRGLPDDAPPVVVGVSADMTFGDVTYPLAADLALVAGKRRTQVAWRCVPCRDPERESMPATHSPAAANGKGASGRGARATTTPPALASLVPVAPVAGSKRAVLLVDTDAAALSGAAVAQPGHRVAARTRARLARALDALVRDARPAVVINPTRRMPVGNGASAASARASSPARKGAKVAAVSSAPDVMGGAHRLLRKRYNVAVIASAPLREGASAEAFEAASAALACDVDHVDVHLAGRDVLASAPPPAARRSGARAAAKPPARKPARGARRGS